MEVESWGQKKAFRAEVMNQFYLAQHVFTGRADAKAEAPILWPLDAKSQPIGKDPDAEKD